jgi:hypothetical protein
MSQILLALVAALAFLTAGATAIPSQSAQHLGTATIDDVTPPGPVL